MFLLSAERQPNNASCFVIASTFSADINTSHTILLKHNRGSYVCFSRFLSGNVAVIQLSSDTLSIEYQKQGVAGDGGGAKMIGGGTDAAARATTEGGGGSPSSSSVEGEQVVRCDISIKGFHLQVLTSLNWNSLPLECSQSSYACSSVPLSGSSFARVVNWGHYIEKGGTIIHGCFSGCFSWSCLRWSVPLVWVSPALDLICARERLLSMMLVLLLLLPPLPPLPRSSTHQIKRRRALAASWN